MKILLLDNYDSFTYNLLHIIEALGCDDVDVVRNDKITLDEVDKYDKILLSPGPGIPSEAGIMMSLIDRYKDSKSILGVCLGHQAIAEVFGGKLLNLEKVMHGKETLIHTTDNKDSLFNDMPASFSVGRYHSWVVCREELPAQFLITAQDDNAQIMAIRHKEYDLRGVQFHPESVMTTVGVKMMENWIGVLS